MPKRMAGRRFFRKCQPNWSTSSFQFSRLGLLVQIPVFLIQLLAIPQGFSQPLISEAASSFLHWRQGRPLHWGDFQGDPDPTARAAALSTCGFRVSAAGQGKNFRITVENRFARHQSWVRADRRSPALLQHEQGHFDLSELYTRLLRRRIAEEGINRRNYNARIEELYREVQAAYLAEQERYDRETRSGIDPDQQAAWEALIRERLQESWLYQHWEWWRIAW